MSAKNTKVIKRYVCIDVTCNEPARNMKKGEPCPGCGKMTTVVLREFTVTDRRRTYPRPKSSGRRSDRGDNDTDQNLF